MRLVGSWCSSQKAGSEHFPLLYETWICHICFLLTIMYVYNYIDLLTYLK